MSAPLSPERLAEIRAQIGDAQPATNGLLESFGKSIADRVGHDHTTQREDWFCLNLAAYMGEKAAPVLRRLLDAEARVAELEAERHSTNEALDDAVQTLAARTFYLADVEGVEDGQSLHTTADAAKAWVEEIGGPDGDWFEQDGVWEQWHTDVDTDKPTGRGAGSVLPLTVKGDGILAEAEQLRQKSLAAARQAAIVREVKDSQADALREMQAERAALMAALGCEDDDDWDDAVQTVKRLAGAGGR